MMQFELCKSLGYAIVYVANIVVVNVNVVLLTNGMVLCLTFASFALASSIFDVNDTCSALKDFQRNPQNNILQIILQSEKTKTSDKTLEHIGHTVPNFITQLNSKLTEIQGLGLNDMRENSVGKICDPFSSAPNYNFTPDLCPKDIIPIEELKYLSYKLQFTQHE
uniref:Uncharacterized protein n=1 Tax=Solanum lycopersicum TaxID=4081 RepID=A0A3Q7JA09_SOLLC